MLSIDRSEMSTSGAVGVATPPTQHGSLVVPTKLRPPGLRGRLIDRSELIFQLRTGRSRTLTLVSAPAGYGKTTLLAQWEALDANDTPFAWITLDERDSDPIRLWSHVIVGLRDVTGLAGKTSLQALDAGPRAIPEAVLPCLIDELMASPKVVLVLDDWQAVRNPVCDRTMAAFVERAPASVQVVVSSRSDPGLQVARLRAHGELTEVRAGDLRLSPSEATTLFRQAGIRLRYSDIERLTSRTEGWLAGLCLALLVVQKQEDPRRFVLDFSGDTRHVLDYLAGDVLQAVPPQIRDFLVRTSVLESLSGDLCDYVLETSGSAAILAEIERANLFLIPLDESGAQYRYHHLFAAMLQRELDRGDAAVISRTHTRASEWLESAGEIESAIEHGIASRDVERASALITRYGNTFWSSGRVTTVARWLAALSWPEAAADRQLAFVRAHIAGLAGHGRDEVEQWLAVAETGPDFGPLSNGVASIHSAVGVVRSAYLSRGIVAAEEAARRALELEPPESPYRRVVLIMLGQALYLQGRWDEASGFLDEARSLPGARDLVPAAALGLSYLSLLSLSTDATAEAERIARGALVLLEEHRLASSVAAANPNLALGCALAAGSDLHAAIAHLERAVELVTPAGVTYWRAHALIHLASARHRLGELAGAKEALALARAHLDDLPDAGRLGPLYEETENVLLGRRRREGFLGDELSEAELRILHGLMDGKSLGSVAQELWLSPNTVKTHRRSIYRKLGVNTRAELLARAQELGLATDGDPTQSKAPDAH
jgi:LuxR family maltose regulon positive regulatory protein